MPRRSCTISPMRSRHVEVERQLVDGKAERLHKIFAPNLAGMDRRHQTLHLAHGYFSRVDTTCHVACQPLEDSRPPSPSFAYSPVPRGRSRIPHREMQSARSGLSDLPKIM